MTKTAPDILAESARAEKLRDRHRDYYVALAEQAEIELKGHDQRAWWDLLESEYDNLRLALEWSLSRGTSEEALRLAVAVYEAWYIRGDDRPSEVWLRKALALDERTATGVRARALSRLSYIVWRASHSDAYTLAHEAVDVARKSGDRAALHEALLNLGQPSLRYANRLGGTQAARALLEESLAIAREIGDEEAVAESLERLADRVVEDEGREAGRPLHDEAIRLYRKVGNRLGVAWVSYLIAWNEDPSVGASLAEEALAIGREFGDDLLVSCTVQLIGWQKRWSGEYVAARRVFEDLIEEYRLPARQWEALNLYWMVCELADVEFEMGDFEAAQRHADEVVDAHLDRGFMGEWIAALSLQGLLAAERGEQEVARSKCDHALTMARELARPIAIRQSLNAVVSVALWGGDLATARLAAEETLSIATVDTTGLRTGLTNLANVCLAEGDLDQARSLWEREIESIHSHPWWPYEEPSVQLRLGRVALLAGELETASALFGAALTKFVEIRHRPFAAWALEEFGALAVARSDFEQAGRLYGAGDIVREQAQARVRMNQRRDYDQTLAAIKKSLSDEALEQAWAGGRAMNLDDAVSYALSSSSTSPT